MLVLDETSRNKNDWSELLETDRAAGLGIIDGRRVTTMSAERSGVESIMLFREDND